MDIRIEELHSRADSLVAKFKKGDGVNYLDEGIALEREALGLCPRGHTGRPLCLASLSVLLSDRYDQLGTMTDIEEAILHDREALMLRPPGHPDRANSLNHLATDLSTRHSQLGSMEDLNEAIVLDQEALALRPPGHSARPMYLVNLAFRISVRYNLLGAIEDLDEAIALDRDALALCSPGHPHRATSLNNLATYLSLRYRRLGAKEDLEEAVFLVREAVALCPPGDSDRPVFFNSLANCLHIWYKKFGVIEDLDEAIVLGRDALALRPPGNPKRSESLQNISSYLSVRYRALGTMENLDEAIILDREALVLRPPGHPDRSTSLNNLAVNLSLRYGQLGAMEDLHEAIVLYRDALSLHPPGHPNRSAYLSNLAAQLFKRYTQLGVMEDLHEVIVLDRDALALRPLGHPDRSLSLSNLAMHLSAWHNKSGAIEHLDEAIALAQDALALRPPGHPDRSASLNNLASHLFIRSLRLSTIEDLNQAIALGRDALMLRPPGHPERSSSLSLLTRFLHSRFTRLSQSDDKEEIFRLYAQLAHGLQMVLLADLSAARAWIDAAENFQHHTAVLAYETSLRLLTHHLATLPLLPQHLDLFKSHTSSLAVDAFSACLRNHSLMTAVELLEQGRGVFWAHLSRLRSPLDDVIASGPAGKTLADEFTQLTLSIRNALNSPGTGRHDRLCSLNVELERVVTNIRKLPGLSQFLLPSLFCNLRHAAREGPIIIVNASQYDCDALVVFYDLDPVHVPLPVTKPEIQELTSDFHTLTERAKSMNMTRYFGQFLRRLWDDVVSPITDFLQTVVPRHSRIWWCPTAEFSLLPLHAAGPYREGQQNLADLYISSYTPTLAALIRARRCDVSHTARDARRFVAIGQATAVGENELVSVGTELANIGQYVDGLATLTRIEGAESCIARVTEELGKSDWVHFACHGIPNPQQPFESAFALHDGHFTIHQITQCNLENPEFAYLSACHTTVGDEESPDEVIHLASAMQFAGFRSVIGTMWAVDDAETIKITPTFYECMKDGTGRLDHTRAALALNRTMTKLASSIPLDQRILYIHLGA